MFNIRAQGHRNQDPKDPILYPFKRQNKKCLPTPSVGKNVEQLETPCTAADEDVNWCKYYRKQSGNIYKN